MQVCILCHKAKYDTVIKTFPNFMIGPLKEGPYVAGRFYGNAFSHLMSDVDFKKGHVTYYIAQVTRPHVTCKFQEIIESLCQWSCFDRIS